ncbi:hypothetical protein DQ237_08200 [Blastococcus sp. TF02-8]|nr:hypothetical protein DQ237_08200 [Blastococcus sp. TF02-8]
MGAPHPARRTALRRPPSSCRSPMSAVSSRRCTPPRVCRRSPCTPTAACSPPSRSRRALRSRPCTPCRCTRSTSRGGGGSSTSPSTPG